MAAPSPRIYYVITVRGDVGPFDRGELGEQADAGTVHRDDRVRNAFGRHLGTVASVLSDASSGRTPGFGLPPVEPEPVEAPAPRRSRLPLAIGVAGALLAVGLLISTLGPERAAPSAPPAAPAPVEAPKLPTPSQPAPPPAPVEQPAPVERPAPRPALDALPPGWSTLDLGDARPKGSASHLAGIWTISGGGRDIWDRSDECQLTHRTISDGVVATVRVTAMDDTHRDDKAGLMLRPDLDPAGPMAAIIVSHRGEVHFLRRGQRKAGAWDDRGPTLALPVWLKLYRSGQVIGAACSKDGQAWIGVGREMAISGLGGGGEAHLGLTVCSHTRAVANKAVFDQLMIAPSP